MGLLGDVDMGHAAKSVESGDVRLGARVGLGWGGGNRARGGDIVKKRCIVKRFQPVGLWQVSVGEHGPDFVQEGSVQAFGHAIVLRCVGGSDFMLDSTLLKILLDMACHVLAPSI